MNCEEFAEIGLERPANDAARIAAEHANSCPRCMALQESWREARLALQALRIETQQQQAPPRVEMRLRQEFRTVHRTLKARSAAVFAAWALATAVLLVGAMSWWNWRVAQKQHASTSAGNGVNPNSTGIGSIGTRAGNESDAAEEATLIADNAGDFTLLPGSLAQETDDGAIVRVRMQRGALGALGFPVNEERVSEWIQVDLLVGEDGQPKAVRLPQPY